MHGLKGVKIRGLCSCEKTVALVRAAEPSTRADSVTQNPQIAASTKAFIAAFVPVKKGANFWGVEGHKAAEERPR